MLILWSIYACQFENENEIENVVEIKIIIANCIDNKTQRLTIMIFVFRD